MEFTLAGLRRALDAGEISSLELTEACLRRIEQFNPGLNAFVTLCADTALEQARQADSRKDGGGPLAGIPIAHKDIFCTRGVRTTAGSRILENFAPPYDAAVVERLACAGALLIGKTNMDEFAMGSSSETGCAGPVLNPWDLSRSPGGSSGGSAAAVAAGLVPAATGTDTGGSVRQPAALCGVTGLRPTYGRVSRYGMIAFASSLDQAGPLTRSAEDAALLLDSMAGHDRRDSTCADRPGEQYSAALAGIAAARPLEGVRIGVVREFMGEGLDARCRKVFSDNMATLRGLGAVVRELSLPRLPLSVPVYYVVAPAECSSNLSRFDGVRFGLREAGADSLEELYTRTRRAGFGEEVRRRILVGGWVLSKGYFDAYYLKAQRARRLLADDFATAFESVDLLAGPTTPAPAFAIGEKIDDPIQMYLNDVYTIGAALAGLPCISVPAGMVDGLPVGLQLMGRPFAEAEVLKCAHAYQRETEWHRLWPAESPAPFGTA